PPRVEAPYLRFFEAEGERLRLPQRGLKVVFGGFPTTRCRGGDSRDRIGKAADRQKRDRSSADQLVYQWVELPSLRMIAEHDEALNDQREHQPRAPGVGLTTMRQPCALFIQDCQCAVA